MLTIRLCSQYTAKTKLANTLNLSRLGLSHIIMAAACQLKMVFSNSNRYNNNNNNNNNWFLGFDLLWKVYDYRFCLSYFNPNVMKRLVFVFAFMLIYEAVWAAELQKESEEVDEIVEELLKCFQLLNESQMVKCSEKVNNILQKRSCDKWLIKLWKRN